MPAGSTYTPIATFTVTSQSTVSFTSIPSTYTDLILTTIGKASTAGSSVNQYRIRFNNDTTSNYSNTQVRGDGSTASSNRDSSQTELYVGLVGQTSASAETSIFHIMNYANTTTFKTLLARGNSSSGGFVCANVGLWRKTPEAINRIDIYGPSGETLTGTYTLYGITAA
jgi:hypothetical protein